MNPGPNMPKTGLEFNYGHGVRHTLRVDDHPPFGLHVNDQVWAERNGGRFREIHNGHIAIADYNTGKPIDPKNWGG